MINNQNSNNNSVPLGFGMALSENLKAMNYFSSLTNAKQQEIINQTHNIRSKEEMQAFVNSLQDRKKEV